MPSHREFRFKIDAGYTAETMPINRLVEYLRELAVVLGEDQHIHLLRVDSASAVPVFYIDDTAAERVHARADAVRRGAAPAEAMAGYEALNRMLREDRGRASFFEGAAEIIPFPGADTAAAAEEAPITGILKRGNIDGEVEKIGGSGDWVPVHLRTMEKQLITGCWVRKLVSQELAHHMYKPVRLYGRGRWGRSVDGNWRLERFTVESFDPLNPAPLTNVIANLRKIRGDWDDNPVANLRSLRHDNGEDE